ncbi:MAG TPA: glycosyltransferase, partial [Longimicrobiales bacterium]|nr:glycosyltransferase [Longimicrobiales bacterium]
MAFVCESAPEDSRHLRHLRQRGVATFVGFEDATADLVEGGGFDLAIFAFWYIAHRYAHVVRRLSPDTRIIVESVDLHWLRNARRILGGSAGEQGELDERYGGDLVAELNAYAAADAVLTVSDKEAALVNDIVGVSGLARAVPDCDETPPSSLSFEERAGILFIGNFRHPPNLDAVRFLCGDIMPLLPPLLRARHPLWIVGNELDGRVAEAAADVPGAQLVGWVPSLEPYLHAARVSVIPLRYGAGTKRKAIQALLARTPSVATPVGVEGLDVEDGEHVLVAENAAAFAGALEQLLVDRELWSRLAAGGRERMLATHGRDLARTRFLEAVGEVLARPSRKRRSAVESGEASETGPSALARVVDAYVPEGASVLVVSKGDPALLDLPDRTAPHFPQSENGGYAGFHPRD